MTLDAMGCQRRIAREIKDADAEYFPALKGRIKAANWDHNYPLHLLTLHPSLDA